jgi:hypothetical protein
MSGNVRADDGPGIISDALRCESAAAGVDDGTILAEAHASRERALACRAKSMRCTRKRNLSPLPGPATATLRATPQ